MLSDEKKRAQFIRPVCAFITFSSDDDFQTALEYTAEIKKRKKSIEDGFSQDTIFNQLPMFKSATTPQNIIWENRHISDLERTKK